MSVRLISLDCPSCGSAMHSRESDTLFLCDHCGGGAVLGENGLETVESSALLPTPGRKAEIWLPGWMIVADVEVADRVRAGGRATAGWKSTKTYVIPAFDLPLSDLTRLAGALSSASGATGQVPREPVTGGRLQLADALAIIRHLVIGDEVRRSDLLASLRLEVVERSRRLVALPFAKANDQLQCAVTGVAVSLPPVS